MFRALLCFASGSSFEYVLIIEVCSMPSEKYKKPVIHGLLYISRLPYRKFTYTTDISQFPTCIFSYIHIHTYIYTLSLLLDQMLYTGRRNRSRSRVTFEDSCPPFSKLEIEYASERRRAYPTATPQRTHPDSDEQRCYHRYKAYHAQIGIAEDEYDEDSERVLIDYQRATASDSNMREYYHETSANLLSRHHGELLAAAVDLEEISYRQMMSNPQL